MWGVEEAISLSQEISHPFSLAYALTNLAWYHQLRGNGPVCDASVEAALTLSTDQGFPLFVGMATVLRGWAWAVQGQAEEGLIQMRQGRATLQATGAASFQPWLLALQAEGCGRVGRPEEGVALLSEAPDSIHATEERWYEAEVYRVKGELLLQQSHEQQAEVCFQQAIDIAQKQEAKSWELRAATSLARLWKSQGKTAEARELLAPVYNWFTEGFDTTDLKDAQVLLESLS